MSKRDEFSLATKRLLAERASQRCANPECGRTTSGPSDDESGSSTLLGKAAHITAASKGGPRYDFSLSSAQRSSPDNGVWLCAECADRIDKKENETSYPVELLRSWKNFHESTAGTDFAAKQNRATYPVRQLILENFAGVKGDVSVKFAALTIFYGTSKLSHNIGKLLQIFSNRDLFERVCQPTSTSTLELGCIPVTDDVSLRVTAETSEPRIFSKVGKLRLTLSDDRTFIVRASNDRVDLYLDDSPVPVFSPVVNVIAFTNDYHRVIFGNSSAEKDRNTVEAVASFFGISSGELMSCIEGVPTDSSVFGYEYEIRGKSELLIKLPSWDDFRRLVLISGGESNRFVLDLAVRIASYSSKIKPTVLVIDQANIIYLDQKGWGLFLGWVERTKPSFQVVIDRVYRPSRGDLSHAICYETIGEDMAVVNFRQQTWKDFREPERGVGV